MALMSLLYSCELIAQLVNCQHSRDGVSSKGEKKSKQRRKDREKVRFAKERTPVIHTLMLVQSERKKLCTNKLTSVAIGGITSVRLWKRREKDFLNTFKQRRNEFENSMKYKEEKERRDDEHINHIQN
jgi:hypothetical protein